MLALMSQEAVEMSDPWTTFYKQTFTEFEDRSPTYWFEIKPFQSNLKH